MPSTKPRICFVAHNAFRAITGRGNGHIGGVERQTALMSAWLAERGWDVSVIIWADGGNSYENKLGVRLIPMCGQSAGLPVVRFVHPRITSLWHALNNADADIYYHNTAEYATGVIASWTRSRQRKFVFSSASDSDVDCHAIARRSWRERTLYRRGLQQADLIIVQTEFQRLTLEQGLSLPSSVVPLPCPARPRSELQLGSVPSRTVAWIGRVDPVKRMELLLDVAEMLPDVNFQVAAANMVDTPYANGLRSRASQLRNVNWLGPVPHESVSELYRSSACLCCTSRYEGFPNTFLEAWSHGRPVITTFDPDGLIQTHNLGAYGTTAAQLAEAIRRVLQVDQSWVPTTQRCRDYFDRVHAMDIAMPRFEEHFIRLIRQ